MRTSEETKARGARGGARRMAVVGVAAMGALLAMATRPARADGDRWQGALGVRGSIVRDPSFDPFSSGDGLAQMSFALMHTLRGGVGMVPALGLALDLGGSDATARGVGAELDLWRLALVLEPRFLPAPGYYVDVRLAPGLVHAVATLHDPSAPAPLETRYWTASFDASLGAGVRLNNEMAPAGMWLVAEGGYGWTPRHALTLVPALPAGDAAKAGATELGTLSPRGLFLRAGLAVSY
jgi:hypothetical protein